ncbi:hypothetical protein [Nitrososphaera sp.]|uniref:hypothetical protein n=1 Tax=Nitrososphaera sp. TaxID=1971748 RepID=UPI00307DEAA5
MQTSRNAVSDGTEKARLFGITAVVVPGILAPLILPHVSPSTVYHAVLHIASTTIAVFISIVSLIAYSRNARARMALMMLGFMSLVAVELFYLLSASGLAMPFLIPAVNIELPHVILLAMLGLFGLGVLKVNKSHEDIRQK